MQQAAQEGAGRHDHAPRSDAAPVAERDAGDASVLDDQIRYLAFDEGQTGRGQDPAQRRFVVGRLVLLGARAANGRAPTAVEQPELDPAGVGEPAHLPAQGVDLADEMALGQAAYRRVARHPRHRVTTQRDHRGDAAHARRGQGGLAAGVPGSDHHDVEALLAHFPMQKVEKMRS